MLLRKMSEEVKATAVYSLIIVLGFILSCVVYFTVSDVEDTTKALIERQMPALSVIRQIMASVSEQERVLYEYYTTTEETLYWKSFAAAKNDTFHHSNTLSGLIADKSMLFELRSGLKTINDAASAFQVNMISDNTSWDLARQQLSDISHQRREIIKLLVVLEQTTDVDVTTGYQNTLLKLNNTNTTIMIYSLAIIFVALVTGWYLRVYFRVSRSNKRLAQFTQRNPHPIVSLNQYNDIIYSNPATKKMLAVHKDSNLKEADLIPQSFLKQSFDAKKKTEFVRIEHTLANLSLSCEIHWLSDLNVFDIHISDITEEKKAKQKLNFQAFHCPETALQNGYKLSQVLDYKVLDDAEFSLGLLEMRDYNHFVAGHGVESTRELIRCMASRLHNSVSESEHDIELFKLSEKSFAFVIEANMLEQQIKTFCQQVEKEMEEPLYTDFGEFNIELDIGFCAFPVHAKKANKLMQYAQMALDEAIELEHTSFRYFNHQLSEQLNNTLKITGWLRSATDNNELSLVYQPQLDIDGNRMIGMETLIRWHHGDSYISPVDFIPIAEQTGLIIEIGHWLLMEACAMAKELIDQGHDNLVLAINISPRQFRHPQFLSMIEQVLQDTQLVPAQLELEITEGVILYNEAETIAVLHQLKAMGIQLSIDDFGTGYSSLSYLKQFPIDKLKIDQSFIKNLHSNDEDKAIVQAIINLGKNLGLKIIAEGVEEQMHYDYLKSLHCDEIQGYWYSRPLDKESFTSFVETHTGN